MKVHTISSCFLAITTLVAGAYGLNTSDPPSNGSTRLNIVRILQKAEIVTEVDKSGIVAMSGSGFLANEPVFVTIENAGAVPMLRNVVLAQWIAFADARGMVVSSWQMTDLAGSYKAGFAGGSSDRRTAAYFTGPLFPEAASANLDQCAKGHSASRPCVQVRHGKTGILMKPRPITSRANPLPTGCVSPTLLLPARTAFRSNGTLRSRGNTRSIT